MMKDLPIIEALHRLCPNAKWYFKEDLVYENLYWQEDSITKPSKQQLQELTEIVAQERQAIAYKAKRAKEYPPLEDYLDGIVKGDQAQITAYIDACQAVKQKYPKPE